MSRDSNGSTDITELRFYLTWLRNIYFSSCTEPKLVRVKKADSGLLLLAFLSVEAFIFFLRKFVAGVVSLVLFLNTYFLNT